MKQFACLALVSATVLSMTTPAHAFNTLAFTMSGGNMTKFAQLSMILPSGSSSEPPVAHLSVVKGPARDLTANTQDDQEDTQSVSGVSFVVDPHSQPVEVSIAYRKNDPDAGEKRAQDSLEPQQDEKKEPSVAVSKVKDVTASLFHSKLPGARVAVQSDGLVSVWLPPDEHTQRVFASVDPDQSTETHPVLSVAMGHFGDEMSNTLSHQKSHSLPVAPFVGLGLTGAAFALWRRNEAKKYAHLGRTPPSTPKTSS